MCVCVYCVYCVHVEAEGHLWFSGKGNKIGFAGGLEVGGDVSGMDWGD